MDGVCRKAASDREDSRVKCALFTGRHGMLIGWGLYRLHLQFPFLCYRPTFPTPQSFTWALFPPNCPQGPSDRSGIVSFSSLLMCPLACFYKCLLIVSFLPGPGLSTRDRKTNMANTITVLLTSAPLANRNSIPAQHPVQPHLSWGLTWSPPHLSSLSREASVGTHR